MMRMGEKKMNSRIRIKCNHQIYCIVRSAMINSEKKRDLKESLKFYELDKDERIVEDLTCDDRVKTQKKIDRVVCSYEQMVNQTIVLQKNGMSFSTLNEREKRELLCGIARLNIFDRIATDVKSKYCSTVQMLSRVQKKYQELSVEKKKINVHKIIRNNQHNLKKIDTIDRMLERYMSMMNQVDVAYFAKNHFH